MKNRKISMQHIANKLGISKVTVSKALNNQSGVGDVLKKKVIETAHELGYFSSGKSPASGSDRFVYLVPKKFFFENENFYSQIYYYLSKKCHAENKELILFILSSEEENNLSVPQTFQKGNIDGIFIGGETSQAYLYALMTLNLPLISIDHFNPQMKIDCILADNFSISYSLTTYLIEKGHKKIGFVGRLKTSNYLDRYYGFQKALTYGNVPFNDQWNIVSNVPETGPYFMYFQLPADMPTAFVCECDLSACFLMQKLQAAGYGIPDNVSVASFDNTEISKSCNPPLTTVNIDRSQFAEKAFGQMLARIEDTHAPMQTLYISTEIIERNSVGNIENSSI